MTIELKVPSAKQSNEQLCLYLERHRTNKQARGSVLLLHGASASSETFLEPPGRSLVDYLTANGMDVFRLDWRGGHKVAEQNLKAPLRDAFTMDAVVDYDIPAAIAYIRKTLAEEHKPGLPLHIVAHCFGAGCVAMWIAARMQHELRSSGVTNVVLLTLGLFYVAPWDGFIKADDFVLERVLGTAPQVTAVSPRAGFPRKRPAEGWAAYRARRRSTPAAAVSTTSETPHIWPSELEEAFESWPKQLLPTCDVPLCHRVSFMFGQPYLEDNLAAGIHTKEKLDRLFGSMPIALYVHAGQNVRRGYAAPFDAHARGDERLSRYLQREPFDDHHVTLITGTENTIWHCDSIHRMHDWLMSGTKRRVTKHVLAGYAHQDLLWGKTAARDVFPRILAGLLDVAT